MILDDAYSFFLLTSLFITLIYLPNFQEGYFIIDDLSLIGAPQISGQVPLGVKLQQIFTPFVHIDFYPVRDFSYLLDWSWGVNLEVNLLPAKIQNLAWFLFCGILIYKIMTHLKTPPKWAIILSIFWLVHPYNAELLLWVSGRKDLLALVFTLAGIYSLLKYDSLKGKSLWGMIAILSFAASALSKAGLLVVPMAFLFYLRIFKLRPKKTSTLIYLYFISTLNFLFLFMQKWQYSAVNDMNFNYSPAYRIQGIITAFGKMVAGLFYFPAIIIDWENWGEWANLNKPYFFLGLTLLLGIILISWILRKDRIYWLCFFLSSGIYILIPGVNIFHRNFFSTRYFTPLMILGLVAIGIKLRTWQPKPPLQKAFFPLVFIFIASVVHESENWHSNKAIWDKAANETTNQPNALFNRFLTYTELHRWGRTTSEDIATMKADAAKLYDLCSVATQIDHRNGSLCFSYWQAADALSLRLPQIVKPISKLERIKMNDSYYKNMEKLKNIPKLSYSESDKLSESEEFQMYKYYKSLNLVNATPELRAFQLIDKCIFESAKSARDLYEKQLKDGLVKSITVIETIDGSKNAEEKKMLVNCFKNGTR